MSKLVKSFTSKLFDYEEFMGVLTLQIDSRLNTII